MEDQLKTSLFPTWCPGCGDFGIWGSLKAAIRQSNIPMERVVVVYGIGCSGNMASFIKVYGFHGLHGRGLPAAAGIKLSNHRLKVIVVGGDGDLLGEGMAHFVASCRSNHDVTVILHNNQVYGLTTGQNSPTALKGTTSKSSPLGVIEEPINPVQLALVSGASHVLRGFAGDIPKLSELMKLGIAHEGFSLVDVLQPCVTFNKLNTYDWFRERIKYVDKPYGSALEAVGGAQWTEETIMLGELYKEEKPAFHKQIELLNEKTLIQQGQGTRDLMIVQKGLA